MFGQMRAAISIPANEDILDHIYSLSAAKQDEAFAKIQAIEREAMAKQVPQPGVRELMRFLDQRGVRKAICTRNFECVVFSCPSQPVLNSPYCSEANSAPVFHFLTTHLPSSSSSISLPFSPIITRDFRPPKPHPAGILHIASQWGIPTPTLSASSEDTASERRLPPRPQPLLPIIMVGDSVDDMAAGRDAGALTVLLRSEGKEDLEGDARVDVVVGRYV